jgi:HEAT repeat protein
MDVEPRTALDIETREVDAATRAAAAWVNQLGRTLKTCRLYDGNNPTVIRFREDLAAALTRVLDEHGALTLQFTSDDVKVGEHSLYPARSRDDNLALPFHRDGVRHLTFSPGIESQELDRVIDAILQVTGQNVGQDDLVTLLWEAHLPHVDVDYVPSEGDIGSGATEEGEASIGIPWPSTTEEADADEQAAAAAAPEGETGSPQPSANGTRSDDWTTGELTVEIEAGYAELDAMAPWERDRFLKEFQAEHEVSPTTTALAILRATLATDLEPEDRAELAQFTPRLLRLAAGRGAWLEAHEAVELLRSTGDEEMLTALVQELLQPISVSTSVEHLDHQETQSILDFIDFARSLGDTAVDLLNAALGESQQRRNRRLLAEALAALCRDNPERLAPWLTDRRWYVVRNVVHILGWIGGDAIVGMLRTALNHPEPRVRFEVVAALAQVEISKARPVLLQLLEKADTRMFCAVLHQLSAGRDGATARVMMKHLFDPSFEQRPPEERRAIYSALSAVAGDEVIAELEAELMKGSWFSRGQELHRQAIARVIARIGTPTARMVLQRGALSKRGPVRKASEDALIGMSNHE